MVGLATLALIVAYVAVCWLIVKQFRSGLRRVLAGIVAIAIPFWDLPFGYLNFKEHCSRDGGLHVVQKIAPQRAICTEPSFRNSPQILLRKGFEVVEFRDKQKTVRYQNSTAGGLEASTVPTLVSAYCLSVGKNVPVKWNTVQRDVVARDVASGAVVARYTAFSWHGGWWKPATMPSEGERCFEASGDELLTVLRTGSR